MTCPFRCLTLWSMSRRVKNTWATVPVNNRFGSIECLQATFDLHLAGGHGRQHLLWCCPCWQVLRLQRSQWGQTEFLWLLQRRHREVEERLLLPPELHREGEPGGEPGLLLRLHPAVLLSECTDREVRGEAFQHFRLPMQSVPETSKSDSFLDSPTRT